MAGQGDKLWQVGMYDDNDSVCFPERKKTVGVYFFHASYFLERL